MGYSRLERSRFSFLFRIIGRLWGGLWGQHQRHQNPWSLTCYRSLRDPPARLPARTRKAASQREHGDTRDNVPALPARLSPSTRVTNTVNPVLSPCGFIVSTSIPSAQLICAKFY
jgi:hypothetical protein